MECSGIIPPWWQELLARPEITDICFNGAENIFLETQDEMGLIRFCPPQIFSDEDLKKTILHLLTLCQKTWDARFPFCDFTFNESHRVHVVFPPCFAKIAVSMRRLARSVRPESSVYSVNHARWKKSEFFWNRLQNAFLNRETVLISGATGSGKTTFLNDLIGTLPHHERIIALEDVAELFPQHPHFLSLQSRPPTPDGVGEVSLRDLLRQALRMRPDRIILGECRGAEVLDLMQVINTGHPGAAATLHANSPRDALLRLEWLIHLSTGGNISPHTIRLMIALGIQWLVHLERSGCERKIRELSHIEGLEGETIVLRPQNIMLQ